MYYLTLNGRWNTVQDPGTWATPGTEELLAAPERDWCTGRDDNDPDSAVNPEGILLALENAGYSVRTQPDDCCVETFPGTDIWVSSVNGVYSKVCAFSTRMVNKATFPPTETDVLVYHRDCATIISLVNIKVQVSRVLVLVSGEFWLGQNVKYSVCPDLDGFTAEFKFDLVDNTPGKAPRQDSLYLTLMHYYSVFNPNISLEPIALFSHNIDYVFRIGRVLIDKITADALGRNPSVITWDNAVDTEIYRHQLDIIFRRWNADPLFVERFADQLRKKTLQGSKARWIADNLLQPVLFGTDRDGTSHTLPCGKFDKNGWQPTEQLPDLERVLREYRQSTVPGCFNIAFVTGLTELVLLPYAAISGYNAPAWLRVPIVLPYTGNLPEPKKHMSAKDLKAYLKKNADKIKAGVNRLRKDLGGAQDYKETLENFLIDMQSAGMYLHQWHKVIDDYMSRQAVAVVTKSVQTVNALLLKEKL